MHYYHINMIINNNISNELATIHLLKHPTTSYFDVAQSSALAKRLIYLFNTNTLNICNMMIVHDTNTSTR